MSTILLTFTHRVASVLTDADSVVLSDPTGTFGVKRTDTDAVVVADATAMTRTAAGTYQYSFTAPAEGLTYTWYAEWIYLGATYRAEFSYEAGGSFAVSLAEAKTHLRVTETADDDLIESLIEAASNWAQKYQNRKYLTETCVDYLDAWPKVIRTRWSPLIAVTSIQYVDTGGTTQTWANTLYTVDTITEPARIVPAYNESYPDLRGDQNGIIVTYTAGYGSNRSDVPQEIRSAILLLVGQLYANREAAIEASLSEIPYGVKALLGMERICHA